MSQCSLIIIIMNSLYSEGENITAGIQFKCSGVTLGRVLDRELYAHSFQQLTLSPLIYRTVS